MARSAGLCPGTGSGPVLGGRESFRDPSVTSVSGKPVEATSKGRRPRWRLAALVVPAAVLAVAGAYWYGVAPMAATEAPPPAPLPVAAVVEPPAPAPVGPDELTIDVQSGDTLDSLFRENELSLVDLAEILDLDLARRNLRILRPGETLRIQHEDDRVLGLERDVDIGQVVRVERKDDGFQARLVDLPVERRRVEATGRISSSLFEAAATAHISERLIMKLAEIFAWDIDFVRDVGRGDEFTVVYEELWRNGEKLGEGNILAAEFVNRGSPYSAVRFEDDQGEANYYTADGRPMRKAFVRAPVSFTRISSGFNLARMHPILNVIRAHQGVDYAAPAGTPVKAAGDGKVIFRGWKGGYGNVLIVQHGGNITTLYGHLSRFAGQAQYGSRVRQGDVIAFVGATGLATAPHLHYEYRVNGVHLDPRTVHLPDAEPLTGSRLTAFRTEATPLLDLLRSRRGVLAANDSPAAPGGT